MTMAREIDLACIGRAAVDLYGEQWGAPLEQVSTFARYLGGSPANTAVGAARLGLRVAMITRVGAEQNGTFVRARLSCEGIDVSQVRTDPDRLTALVFLAVKGDGEFPHVFYRERCADMGLVERDIDPGFIARCGAVLLSGTHLSEAAPRAACIRAARLARGNGARVILDIDYRPVLWGAAGHALGDARDGASAEATRRLQEVLPLCDLVVGTEEEFHVAGGDPRTADALRTVRELTSATLVLKRGSAGCTVFPPGVKGTPTVGVAVPGFPVEVFNVLGAGDAFMAGFLAAWLHGESAQVAARQGNACGALVVSRHGCAPAMPGKEELAHFMRHGPATPRVRDDAALARMHWIATRPPAPARLFVLAFDHRVQLEAAAAAHGAGAARISDFKDLVGQAVLEVASRQAGVGAIIDDRHGERVLARLTGGGLWIARPVEQPITQPLAFERGAGLGLAMRAWPAGHVAKCLVAFDAADAQATQEAHLQALRELVEACAHTGHELLLEVIPPAIQPTSGHDSPDRIARALEALYRAGIAPDWWKLPPVAEAAAWHAIDAVIDANDPACRGVLVLGMEASTERLREGFAAATQSRWTRGFAVGRSIWAEAAEGWLGGTLGGDEVVRHVATRYEAIIALWKSAETANQQRTQQPENA